jgi:hypothetical protein
MTEAVRDWRVDLVEAYPSLFHPPAGGSGPSCYREPGEGWRDLPERACGRIQAALDFGTFTATQIKAKFARCASIGKATFRRTPRRRSRRPSTWPSPAPPARAKFAARRAGATLRIIGRNGLEGVTHRAVAAEAAV